MTRENNCKERLLLTETGMLEWVGEQGAGGGPSSPRYS